MPNMLAVLAGILINNARLSDTNTLISELRSHMDSQFAYVDRRFDEMRDLWAGPGGPSRTRASAPPT